MEITELQIKKIIENMVRIRKFDSKLMKVTGADDCIEGLWLDDMSDAIMDIYQIPKDDYDNTSESGEDKNPYSFCRDYISDIFEDTLYEEHTIDELINQLKSTANEFQHIYINQLADGVKDAEQK